MPSTSGLHSVYNHSRKERPVAHVVIEVLNDRIQRRDAPRAMMLLLPGSYP
jgi:predicted N-formylglutamate amidohydrolase